MTGIGGDTGGGSGAAQQPNAAESRETLVHIFVIVCFVTWPFLRFAAANTGGYAEFQYVFGTGIVAGAAALILYAVARRWAGSASRLSRPVLAAGVAFAMVFSYGMVEDVLDADVGTTMAAWGALSVIFVAGAWWVGRFPVAALVGAVVVLGMSATAAVDLGGYALKLRDRMAGPAGGGLTATPGRPLPNVYYILFDEMGRSDHLREALGLDDQAFREEMEGHGFQFLDNSQSNYPYTYPSVSTILNMDYWIDPGPAAMTGKVRHQAIMAGHNNVVRLFHALGYTYAHAQSGGWVASRCWGVESFCHRTPVSGLNETGIAILAMTPLERILRRVRPEWLEYERSWLPGIVDWIRRVDESVPGPLFVFALLDIPHDPVYDAECRTVPLGGRFGDIPLARKKANYGLTIQCINDQILTHVSRLIADDPDAIVILQSDHGFYFSDVYRTTPYGRWPKRETQWRFGNLTAIRAPAECAATLYPTMTPVNTFRFVRACLVGGNPDYVPDKLFKAEFGRNEVVFWRDVGKP